MAETARKSIYFSEEEQKFLIETKIPLRLSCLTPQGWPMILSLWFLYSDGKLFCSTQRSSKLVQFLMRNPRCAFEVAPETPPYRGIRGKAAVELQEEGAMETLGQLIDRYLGGRDSSLAQYLLTRDNEIAIIIKPIKLYTWDYSVRMHDALLK